MPQWRRSAWRPARSASGHSTRSVARSCATPASPSSRWSIGRPCWPRSRRGRTRRRCSGSTPSYHGSRSSSASRPTRSRRTRLPARPRPHSSPTSARWPHPAGSTSTISSCGRSPSSSASRRCWRAGARGAGSCSSTRSRTSIGHSSDWRSCWPRRPTGSSSSATTTSRSTAGGSRTSAASSASTIAWPASVESISRSTIDARGPSSNAPSVWSSTTPNASQRSSGPGPERSDG